MNSRTVITWAAAIAAGIACGATQAQQNYPVKTVRFIIP